MTDFSDPYAAPAAMLGEPAPALADHVLADRGARLAAALIDGALRLGIWLPLLALVPLFEGDGVPRPVEWAAVLGGVAVLAIALIAWNCLWLHQAGQTPGKRALGIRIVGRDGRRVGLGRLVGLRFAPMFVVNLVLGGLSWSIDVLLIFGAERRCLHDLMADTIVVRA